MAYPKTWILAEISIKNETCTAKKVRACVFFKVIYWKHYKIWPPSCSVVVTGLHEPLEAEADSQTDHQMVPHRFLIIHTRTYTAISPHN